MPHYKKERGQLKREFKEKSNLMDSAYSELKRAQDALNKSIVQKRRGWKCPCTNVEADEIEKMEKK